jgi:phage FluMu protein gp41
MDTQSTAASSGIDDLFNLTLVDGLPVETGGKTIRYRIVKLRETGVADERLAQRAAERVVLVGGVHKLLVSDADFRFALTARHIEAFVCDGQTIPQAVIDMDVVGKLSTHDFGLIEQRVFLLTLAAEVRYGNMSQADFERIAAGNAPAQTPAQAVTSPQRGGQTVAVGQAAAEPQSGPALLADFSGDAAAGTASGHVG